MGKKLVIETVTLFVAEDDEGEGLIGSTFGGSTFVPFVACNMERAEQLYPHAVEICAATGKQLKVLQFLRRVDATEQYKEIYKL